MTEPLKKPTNDRNKPGEAGYIAPGPKGLKGMWSSLPKWARWFILGLILFGVVMVVVDSCQSRAAVKGGEWVFDTPELPKAPTRAHVCIHAADVEEYEGKLRYLIVAPDRMGRLDTVACTTRHAAEEFLVEGVPVKDRPNVVVRRLHKRQISAAYEDGEEFLRIERGKRWYKPWSWFRR